MATEVQDTTLILVLLTRKSCPHYSLPQNKAYRTLSLYLLSMRFPSSTVVTFSLLFFTSFSCTKIWTESKPYYYNHETFETLPNAMTPNPTPYHVYYEDGTKSPSICLRTVGKLTSQSAVIYEETLDGYTVKQNGNKYEYVDVNDKTGQYIYMGVAEDSKSQPSTLRKKCSNNAI